MTLRMETEVVSETMAFYAANITCLIDQENYIVIVLFLTCSQIDSSSRFFIYIIFSIYNI
jgi:hypothetical protein